MPGNRPTIWIAVCLTLVAPACSMSGDEPQPTIEVDINHSRFAPGRVTVEPGATVRFIVSNHDPIDHEFILGNERIQEIHEGGKEARHGARPGEISIPAGSAAATSYTFEGPGKLIFGCHLPGHYVYGMKGFVVIEA